MPKSPLLEAMPAPSMCIALLVMTGTGTSLAPSHQLNSAKQVSGRAGSLGYRGLALHPAPSALEGPNPVQGTHRALVAKEAQEELVWEGPQVLGLGQLRDQAGGVLDEGPSPATQSLMSDL